VSADKTKEGGNAALNTVLEFNFKPCLIPCLMPLADFEHKLSLLLLSPPEEKLMFLRAITVDTEGLQLKTNLM